MVVRLRDSPINTNVDDVHPDGPLSNQSPMEDTDMQETGDTEDAGDIAEIEGTGEDRWATIRKLYGAAIISVFLFAAFGTALPTSKVSAEVSRYAEPVAWTTGFHQWWQLFAANPTVTEFSTSAVVTFADGSTETWSPKDGLNNFNTTRAERWRKWGGRARLDENEWQWPAIASYVARQYEGREVQRVELVRTWSNVPPPEDDPDVRGYYDFTFYDWDPVSGTGEVTEATDGFAGLTGGGAYIGEILEEESS